MTAAVTDPFKLTWGSFVVGGTTDKLISGIHRISRDFTTWEITLDVVIRATSDATFATNCAEIESEFSKRRQSIKFEVGSSTIHTFNPTAGTNTGLNSYARVVKVGTPGGDTDRSRVYTITVGCELPASDTSGRRDSSIVVEYDPAQRRTVTISGTWTALTSNGATAQYTASIAAFCSSALGALLPSATFELISQRTQADDQDKVLAFMRMYREVVVAQPSGSLDNANIVEPTFGFSRAIDQPGDSGGGGVKRLETITASFSCYLDKTASTDVPTLYTGTVRPYMITQFETTYAPTQYAIISERPTHQPYSNQLFVEIVFQAAIDATDVIESVTTSRIVEGDSVALTGAWTGQFFAKYADQNIGTRRRFGIRAVRVLGALDPKTRIGSGGGTVFGVSFDFAAEGGSSGGSFGGLQPSDQGGSSGGTGWVLMDNDSSATVKHLGQPNGDQILITDLVETTVEEYVVSPSGGGQAQFGVSFTGASN